MKNKSKEQNEENEAKLAEPYLLPNEQIFEDFLFQRKGYRFKPIKRDGNCLFGAVADQVYGDPKLHSTVRNWCANFMEEEKHFYEGFILDTTNFTKYIEDLRKNGTWGGNFELMAISELYNCRLEVYENSENPRVVNAWNFQGSNNHPIRLLYKNYHYASVRSGEIQNSNFSTIEPGEMEQNMLSQAQFLKSQNFKSCSLLVEDLSIADPELKYAIELSKAIEESRKSFLLYHCEQSKKQQNKQ